MAAIDEDEQLDALGAAVVEEGVEGGADGTAGVEDVVHKDDVAAGDVEAEVALGDGGAGAGGGEVVSVELDVEGADGLIRPAGDGYPTTPWQNVFLSSRAGTIYSGTSEIQRNIIAERAIGLPKEPRVRA